jgi:acetyl-CoA acetyltransferase
MRDVSIIGIGQVPVGDLWDKPIYILAVEAMLAAIRDSKVAQIDSVYIGNMLSSTLAGQDSLCSRCRSSRSDRCGSCQSRSGLLIGRHSVS